MRRRSTTLAHDESHLREEAFIDAASTEQEVAAPKTIDLHRYVRPRPWPIIQSNPTPSLAKGREDLKKPLLIHLTEQQWNSIERHTTVLGVSKASWVRHAIMRLLEEEQQAFLHMKEGKE